MKFIQIERFGSPDVLKIKDMPKPKPGKGEVLIHVKASGVNRPDVLQRKGLYPPPAGASPVLGLEVSGFIEELGEQTGGVFEKNQAVCALVSGGGYAEYCVAPAGQCLPVPRGVSVVEAAGIPENFFTVWTNVFTRGRLQKGESILIHGGTSGIGVAAIQLAREFGALVFATAGSDQKCKACRDLGAEGAINYKTEDFVEAVKEKTSGQGVNLILDMVGGPYFERNLQSLAQDGRLVQIAHSQGMDVSLSLNKLMSRGLTLTGSTLRPRSVAQKSAIAAQLQEKVWPLFESGCVKVIMDQSFPLEKAAEAHALMESSQHIGKIVLLSGDVIE